MQFQLVPYLWLSLAALIVMAAVFALSWRGRQSAGVRLLLLCILLGAVLVIGQAMEIGCAAVSDKLFWANVQYTVLGFLPVAYFYMALCYVGSWQWMKKRWLLAALLCLGLITTVFFWTNPYHHLLLRDVYISGSQTLNVLGKTRGPLFTPVVVIYTLLSLLILAVLIRSSVKQKTGIKGQTLALLLGILIPLGSMILHYTGILRMVADPTTLTMCLSSLIIFWGILRHRLFDVVKIAHSMVMQELTMGLIITDMEGTVLEITPAAKAMLGLDFGKPGYQLKDLLESYPGLLAFYESGIPCQEELALETQSGIRYFDVFLTPLRKSGGKALGWMLQLYDMTARKEDEASRIQAASLDPLTGLLNRGHFHQRLCDFLDYAKSSGTTFAVAYVDLDDFKPINDTYGHTVGDACLREVALRLKGHLREMDVVTRYGGDEFVVLLPCPGGWDAIMRLGEKMSAAFEEPFYYGGHSFMIRASIGISVYPDHGDSPEDLIAKADKAMYTVKSMYKNGVCIYQES